MPWRIPTYIWHQFHIRHRHGYGIHSPYLFEFINGVLFNEMGLQVPGGITELHRILMCDRSVVPDGSGGAPSQWDQPGGRSVGSFVRRSSVSPKYGALLFRISRWFRPEMIVELGTGLGVSTLYLSAGQPDAPLHTIEGNKHRAEFARSVIKRSGLAGVHVHVGDMDQELGRVLRMAGKGLRLLAFVDGNHRYDPTLGYIRKLVEAAGEEAVIVVDDIYWSKGMLRAWREVASWPGTRVDIDLFRMGILLLRKDLPKRALKIKF